MATKEVNVTKQMMAVANGGQANPGDLHIPIGRWTALSWNGRALLYAPISFSGMTSINEARLYLKAHAPGSGWHAKGTSSGTVRVRRKTASWSETSNGISAGIDETWGGNGQSLVTSDIASFDTGNEKDLGDLTHNDWYWIQCTSIVRDWFNGSANHGVLVQQVNDEDNPNRAKEFWSRHSSGDKPYFWIDYNTNSLPGAPTNLLPTGNTVVHTGTTVTVYGSNNDSDSGDDIVGVRIKVFEDDGTTEVYYIEYFPSGSPQSFSRNVDLPRGNTFYKWQAKTKDDEGWGPYSSLQRFKANSLPNPPITALQESPTTDIMTLTPSFSVTFDDPDASYGDSMNSCRIIVEDTLGNSIWNSGVLTVPAGTVNFVKLYNGPALSWATTYNWRAQTEDTNAGWGNYSTNKSFTTHKTGVPITLTPSGNTVVGNLTPTFKGNRASTADTIASYQIELYESNGTTLKWSSGTLSTGITSGASFSKLYNGAGLSYSTTYKWRARLTGTIGATSDWSALQTFQTPSATAVTQNNPVGEPITTLTPAFTGSWPGGSLNAIQILLYAEDGVTLLRDTGTIAQSVGANYSWTYTGAPALTWNTTYKWQVRVRNNSDSQWQPYSGLTAFTTDSAGSPTLTAPINNSWQTTLTPTFTGTTFSGEVISTYRIRLYASDGVTLIWDSGNLAGSSTSFSKVYNGPALTAGSAYKWQASYVKSTGPTGPYSALQTFHVNAAPLSPTALSPANGAIVGSLTPNFTSTFQDLDKEAYADFPTTYEIEVRNNATDALIATQTKTTGLISGVNTMTWDGTPALAYETTYKWRARYIDSKSATGAWSSYQTFKPSQPSTLTITNPSGPSIDSPSVVVSWTFNSPGGKTQSAYRIEVLQTADETMIYDSGEVLSSSTSHQVPAGFLRNGVQYNFVVTAVDTDGI